MVLAHWGRDKMVAISQRTFSNACSWIKMFKFRLKFHWSLFPRVWLTLFQYWFRWWLDTDQATSHYLNQWLLDSRCIYASLDLNELTVKDKQVHVALKGLRRSVVVDMQAIKRGNNVVLKHCIISDKYWWLRIVTFVELLVFCNKLP